MDLPEKLPIIISKQDLCQLFNVKRFRQLRRDLFTDTFVKCELKLSLKKFNERQQFTVTESILIKQYLIELSPEKIRQITNSMPDEK